MLLGQSICSSFSLFCVWQELAIWGTAKPLRQFIFSRDLADLVIWATLVYKGLFPLFLFFMFLFCICRRAAVNVFRPPFAVLFQRKPSSLTSFSSTNYYCFSCFVSKETLIFFPPCSMRRHYSSLSLSLPPPSPSPSSLFLAPSVSLSQPP
jgi:hypothetical protein